VAVALHLGCITGPALAETVSLAEIRRQALAYADALQVPGKPLGYYFDSLGSTSAASLYASCDVAHLRTVMGEDLRKTLAPEQRRVWIDHINSYGLAYMHSLAPQHRRADILEAARRHGRGPAAQWPAFRAKKPDLHVLLGAVGAFGLLQQLLPETFVDDVRWTDIFSDPRLYQTLQVEKEAQE
jgi:hypothetical protein